MLGIYEYFWHEHHKSIPYARCVGITKHRENLSFTRKTWSHIRYHTSQNAADFGILISHMAGHQPNDRTRAAVADKRSERKGKLKKKIKLSL
jgi:hypothetical protein